MGVSPVGAPFPCLLTWRSQTLELPVGAMLHLLLLILLNSRLLPESAKDGMIALPSVDFSTQIKLLMKFSHVS